MKPQETIVIHSVGDVGLHGRLAASVKEYGSSFPFVHVRDTLRSADIRFANLEIPFASEDEMLPDGRYRFVPPQAIGSLCEAGFNLVSLANNHIMDFGTDGLERTLSLLRDAGIAHVGAGVDLRAARKPAVLTVKGTTVGLLSYAMQGHHTATKNKPGAAPMDLGLITEDLRELRRNVDIVLVSLHFGMIYTDYPTAEQRQIAHKLVDEGALLILGHHPHVCQGIETHANGLIAYSLGEFVFDPAAGNIYARIAREKRKMSIILRCVVRGSEILECTPLPVHANASLQPVLPGGPLGEKISRRIADLSKPLTNDNIQDVDLFEMAGNDLVPYQMQVYGFHLRKFHVRYIARQILRLRGRHLRLLLGYLRAKFSTRSRTKVS